MAGTPNIPGSEKHQGWAGQREEPQENGLVRPLGPAQHVQEQGLAPIGGVEPRSHRLCAHSTFLPRKVNTLNRRVESLTRASLTRAGPEATKGHFEAKTDHFEAKTGHFAAKITDLKLKPTILKLKPTILKLKPTMLKLKLRL